MTQVHFDNSYARLPDRFFARVTPQAAPAPRLLAFNAALAADLGIAAGPLEEMTQIFAGNRLPQGAEPIAQAYAGHQFGGFVPQLGDGRAILLGEVVREQGRFDIQLKGAGRTPFSRGGDGRAWLGPVLREYVLSEAMAALGIPTTRALAAVTTGEDILREDLRPGAVLTRVAQSHIRVGTFQYFAVRNDREALQILLDHVIARHYPEAQTAEDVLIAMRDAQARLIAQWMGVGFIHGVMNTDNMTISGETVDYGPAAFMDRYDPEQVFSAIDQYGRYAYANQPNIAVWNIAQFATALLPLAGQDREAAIARFTQIVQGFADRFDAEWHAILGRKLGLGADHPAAEEMGLAFLTQLARLGGDFTRAFRALGDGGITALAAELGAPNDAGLQEWGARWAAETTPDTRAQMQAANPRRIPRNHQVEAMITAALAGDLSKFERLNAALAAPFAPGPAFAEYEAAPRAGEEVTRTFCGT
ncbi:YdiU family protein [Rhodobacteraceae bacterium XHP0102]|nr:YdiU family protein [Rhodobacteraceae bacterium XHP0102]